MSDAAAESPLRDGQFHERALMATMIGQDALVSLLMAKGLITDEELTVQVRESRERIAQQITAMKEGQGLVDAD
jgi:hypothetical protein